jgi:hypothetical protein
MIAVDVPSQIAIALTKPTEIVNTYFLVFDIEKLSLYMQSFLIFYW